MAIQSTASLQELYSTKIQPALEQLETDRKAVLGRCVNAGLLAGGVAIMLIGGLLLISGPLFLTIFIAVGTFLAWNWATSAPRALYRATFKQKVIGELVGFIGKDLSFHPDDYISESEFMACQLFTRRPDRYRGEDLLRGIHGTTRLRFSEVHAEYKTESRDADGDRQEHWHDIFKGILFIADFNKHFAGLTLVEPDNAERMMGFVGKALQGFGNKFDTRGELIALDDPAFEQAFKVTATDQVEARYILSPSLMRRILEFKQKTGREIRLAFHASSVYVAVPSKKNLFEAPSLLTSIPTTLSIEKVQEYFADLLLFIGIVDELDLNTRIWSKGPVAVG